MSVLERRLGCERQAPRPEREETALGLAEQRLVMLTSDDDPDARHRQRARRARRGAGTGTRTRSCCGAPSTFSPSGCCYLSIPARHGVHPRQVDQKIDAAFQIKQTADRECGRYRAVHRDQHENVMSRRLRRACPGFASTRSAAVGRSPCRSRCRWNRFRLPLQHAGALRAVAGLAAREGHATCIDSQHTTHTLHENMLEPVGDADGDARRPPADMMNAVAGNFRMRQSVPGRQFVSGKLVAAKPLRSDLSAGQMP